MLQNRIYRGEITQGNAYPGEHTAIVDEALWDKVQAVLAENRVDRATGARAKYPSLLAGLAFDDSGERLTPTHAVKKGTRYRYYFSKSLITGHAKDHSQGRRIPAGNLEGLVIGRLRAFLADEGAVLSTITDAEQNGAQQKRLIARGRQISEELGKFAEEVSLPLETESEGAKSGGNSRGIRHYINDLGWLCWQSGANLSLPAIWGNAG